MHVEFDIPMLSWHMIVAFWWACAATGVLLALSGIVHGIKTDDADRTMFVRLVAGVFMAVLSVGIITHLWHPAVSALYFR